MVYHGSKEDGGQGDGKNVAWDVQFSGATASSYSEGLDVQTGEASHDVEQKAVLNWGMYRSVFHLSDLEIAGAQRNIGQPDALRGIVTERFDGGITKMLDLIEQDLFTGTGAGTGPDGQASSSIVGLDTALAASGTYATIDPGTYTEWVGVSSAHGGIDRALSLDLLGVTEQALFTSCGMEPDLIVTTPGIYTKYEGLFNATVRTVGDGTKPMAAYLGSNGRLNWRSDAIVRARKATSGRIYLLNTSEMELKVLPQSMAPMGFEVTTRTAIDSNGQTQETARLPFTVKPIARLGDSIRYMVTIYLALKVGRRNAHAIIADVSET